MSQDREFFEASTRMDESNPRVADEYVREATEKPPRERDLDDLPVSVGDVVRPPLQLDDSGEA
jgi:hypothetical protein